jgi:hypothetical protein
MGLRIPVCLKHELFNEPTSFANSRMWVLKPFTIFEHVSER